MSWASDKRYGRRGGRFAAPPTPEPVVVPRRAEPTAESVARHLVFDHNVPTGVVDGVDPVVLLGWHAAEHRHRTIVELVGHTHVDEHDVSLSLDERAHATDLRNARDGKLAPARLNEFLDRAAYAAKRRHAGLVLSDYDRRALEVAQAVAERAARLAKRRGVA